MGDIRTVNLSLGAFFLLGIKEVTLFSHLPLGHEMLEETLHIPLDLRRVHNNHRVNTVGHRAASHTMNRRAGGPRAISTPGQRV